MRSGLCWRARPECAAFMVVEFEVGVDLLDGFDPRFELGVGIMKNLSNEWAAGGLVAVVGGVSVGLSVRGRARRWLDDELALDAEAGALRAGGRWGLTTGTRFNWHDYGSFFLRYDVVPAVAQRDSPAPAGVTAQEVSPPRRQSLVAGASANSTAAPIALGTLAVSFAVLVAFSSDPFSSGL